MRNTKQYRSAQPSGDHTATRLAALDYEEIIRYPTGRRVFYAFIPYNAKVNIPITVNVSEWRPGGWLFGVWENEVIIEPLRDREARDGDENRLWFERDGEFLRCVKAETINDYARYMQYPN